MNTVVSSSTISVYIHVPFCRQKCSYCDFLSWSDHQEAIPVYVDSLLREINLYRGVLAERQVSTVFFGGGTPSLLSGVEVKTILDAITSVSHKLPEAEISLEANPETLWEEKVSQYADAGINRLSIGLQSTHEHLLKFLGRMHTVNDFYKGVEWARKAGIHNINGDLIFGIPGQTLQEWKDSLSDVVALNLPHLSCYGLTYEEGTPLSTQMENNVFKPVEEEHEWLMFRHAIEWLQRMGYNHYEISNYAKPGYECKHNINYWKNQEYIGLGAGAHGFVDGIRTENATSLKAYLDLISSNEKPIIIHQEISKSASISETCFLGLRMREGISNKLFSNRYGSSLFDVFPVEISKLIERGLLEQADGSIRLTEKGIDLSNQVFEALLLDG